MYDELIDETIEGYRTKHPIDMLGNNGAEGEYWYLRSHRDSYIRTVRDVDQLLRGSRGQSILEVGSFLGIVSIALSKLGYRVSALDIPEFHQNPALRNLYKSHGIRYDGVNLRNLPLPYERASMDAVVACETLEHLNFNPLPLLQEIHGITKESGVVYVGMPNQAAIRNRVRLLLGKSVRNSISEWFAHLDRRDNFIVGLHWREYTLQETEEMLQRMGFDPIRSYYFTENLPTKNPIRALARAVAYSVPSFRPFQVVVGKKSGAAPQHNFWLTEANT